jgi:hydroxyacylglutathione hydrolase
MIFQRIKSEGLAHNSYFLGSGSAAAVIDPRRDVQVYLDIARQNQMKILYILETHRNEDYVIGSLDLAEASGAKIYHGQGLDWKYGAVVRDGQEFALGKLTLTAVSTPGHTNESMSYVVRDLKTGGAPVMVFSGDSLFIGDTGRVDLYGLAQIQRMAGNLYDSIFKTLLPLGDGVILCSAHGAGSVCGLNVADRDESTLGIERLQNPFLQIKDKNEFIKAKEAEKPERPPYFSKMEQYNRDGAPRLNCVKIPPLLTPAEFKKEMQNGAVVVDASLPEAFGGAHIKGAYSIWLEGLSTFPGWFLKYESPVLLVLEEQEQIEEAVKYLMRLGYDRAAGYLKGGIESWIFAGYEVESLGLLSVHQLKQKIDSGEALTLLDVREPEEWKAGHLKGALNIYVGHLEERIGEVPKDKPVVVYCTVGHRAGIGASILLRAGFPMVYNTLGSMVAWRSAGFPVTQD